MKTSTAAATEEVQASVEPRIPGLSVAEKKAGPDRELAPFLSDNKHSDKSAPSPRRGLTAVEFRCPRCGSKKWGTVGRHGVCKSVTDEEVAPGWKFSRRCPFEWLRSDDWLVFRLIGSDAPFPTRAAYEAVVG